MWASTDLTHALDAIEQPVDVIRREADFIEFLTRTNYWGEIMETPEGWRVRVYRGGAMREHVAPTITAAMDAARQMAGGKPY